MRTVLSLLVLLGCGSPPQVAPPDDGPCAERLDPLRQDERSPFGLRPNQLRAAIGGPVTGQTGTGASISVTPDWSGGQAVQVWAERVQDAVEAPPDPEPPLWCADRVDLPVVLRAEGDALGSVVERVGVVRAVGPLGGLEVGFVAPVEPVGSVDAAIPSIWVWWSEGRGEVRLAGETVAFTFEVPEA